MLISLHASAFHHFHKTIETNPTILICDAAFSFRILHPLDLTGKETRPLTKDEIDKTYIRYKFFWKAFGIEKTHDA